MSQNLRGSSVVFVYKGKRVRIGIESGFESLKSKVKQKFCIDDDVELVAQYPDSKNNETTEETILDDDDLARLATATRVQVYQKPEDILGIVIGTEHYYLDVVPPSRSNLITVAIHDVVFSQFDVVEFVTKLGGFVEQVRRAHIHLLAVDEKELATQVFDLGRNCLGPVTAGSVNTLDMIVRNCANILTTLVNVFEYLRDGEAQSASINLTSLVEIAESMVKETASRVAQLEDAENECDKLVTNIQIEWSERGKQQKQSDKEHKMAQRQLEAQREKIERANGFVTFLWKFGSLFDAGGYAKEKRLKCAEGKAKEELGELEEIVDNLTTAYGAIKQTRVIMQRMNQFWTGTKLAITELATNESFVKVISAAVERSQKGGRRNVQSLLQCRAFRRQAITFMAKYAAIRNVSSECRQQMTFVQKCMDRFETEMPTKEQAKAMLQDKTAMECFNSRVPVAIPIMPANDSSYEEAKKQFSLSADLEQVKKHLKSAAPAKQLTVNIFN